MSIIKDDFYYRHPWKQTAPLFPCRNQYYHDNQDNDNKICKRQKKYFNCISLDENQICWINTYFFRYTMENSNKTWNNRQKY